MAQLDEAKLQSFVGKMLGDLGGAFSIPTVRIGLRLGLFKTLHRTGPVSAADLAPATLAVSPNSLYARWLKASHLGNNRYGWTPLLDDL